MEEVYDQEQMEFQDLMHILENSTRRMLGENRASIRLECRRTADFSTQEHYRLLSILKNLVTNAIEAIQGAGGRGIVLVEERVEGDTLFLTVSDDGPGISERSMHNLFQVGYSTKFDPETGNINRGVGLPAVKSLTEELGGSVSVDGSPYPKNSHAGFYGLTSVQTALTESLNTCAVDVAMQYGVNKSYRFMTDKLGFSTLTQTDGSQVGAMALGGLEQGVTTEEMAAAYAAFANEGVYTEPRTFVRVEDSDGKVVLENSAMDPRDTYADAAQWDEKAKDLAGRFIKNFAKFTGNEAGKKLVAAGPKL